MKNHPLKVDPGVFTESTDRDGKSKWKDANRVRFHYGYPEKLGGWSSVVGADTVPGVCRETRQWIDLTGVKYVVYGTDTGLYIQTPELEDKVYYDITPADVRTATLGTLTNPFTSVSGSADITVLWTGHGFTTGDAISFVGAIMFNSIPAASLNTQHVLTVTGANNFTITLSGGVVASASGTGGGAVYPRYGLGWGTASWGQGAWGRSVNAAILPNPIGAVPADGQWSLDIWGENLIANVPGGKIYVWSPTTDGKGSPATQIPTSPDKVGHIIVSPVDQHLIALGCVPVGGSDMDPLLVRWADQGNYEDWAPTATNTAGDIPLSEGNSIVSATVVGQNIIISTDTYGYRMYPTGPPSTYGITSLGASDIIAKNAMADYRGVAYWMGIRNFYTYDGSLRVFDCDVWSKVFDDLNYSMSHKVFSGINRAFDEVWWFYPSKESPEVDRYVMFDAVRKLWSLGKIQRTAWDGEHTVFGKPYAVSPSGIVYLHEQGSSANGMPMMEYLVSYDIDVSTPGEDEVLLIGGLVPDFEELQGSLQITVSGKKRPHGVSTPKPAFYITQTTEISKFKLRARQVDIKVAGVNSNGFWRMGPFQVYGQRDGRR